MMTASPRQLRVAAALLVGVGLGCAGGSQERLPTSPPLASASASPAASTTTVRRCARLGARHGAVTCIDELTVEQASHRALSFWLTVRDGRAVRMERRDGAGAPSPASNGMFALEYVYEGGAIVERVGRRVDGSVVMRTLYADGGTRRTWLDAQGRPWMQPREEGNIALYELDDAGRDRVERMVRADGSPRRDSVGVHVWKYAYDEQGRVVEERAFGATGEPVHTRDGWHIHHREYGKLGCEDSETYLGLDGKLVLASGGVAEYRFTCDPWGNRASVRHFDVEGRPVAGSAGWGTQWTRDEHGKIVMETPLDETGRPRAPATPGGASSR